MNKISMPVQNFLPEILPTSHSQSSDSRWLVNGVQAQTSMSVYYNSRRNQVLFMASTEPEQFTAGPHKAFLLVPRNRTEQQWLKGSWTLKKQVPNFKNKLRQTGINLMSYKQNTGIWHSVCNGMSKLTQKIILKLHRTTAYCDSTAYCSEFTVMPNYSQMLPVVTGCCKDLVAFSHRQQPVKHSSKFTKGQVTRQYHNPEVCLIDHEWLVPQSRGLFNRPLVASTTVQRSV